MDQPSLNAEAGKTVDRAQALATERGQAPADATDVLIALLDAPAAIAIFELFDVHPDNIRTALTFISQHMPRLPGTASDATVADLARATSGTEPRRGRCSPSAFGAALPAARR